MKKRTATKKRSKARSRQGQASLKIAQPGKRLSDLVSVYEDLEKTLRSLKSKSLLQGQNSLMQININKLIVQLSRSKRNIERKISHVLLTERIQIRSQWDKWAPKLGRRIPKRGSKITSDSSQLL